jgi:hypothetical protein
VVAEGRRPVLIGPAGPFLITLTGAPPFSVAGLAAGESATFTFRCDEGSRAALADARLQVAESDEGNNSATIAVRSCR